MKKKIAINKKLVFTKAAVAVLSDAERNMIAGGLANNQRYLPTVRITCNTVRFPEEPCVYCK
ncbi:class I lanthipeptide [Chitinophaga qingshengii]|uniref:Class I lanthipeptide n=1 Tax=Chitinophaga qingshengii TaxID=1569794 RepID=A0ABR7TTB5_9BACT|nr:class I lanthipeptide [Chitinophaga qingshengii]MBC9932862.1 class I lanthipeptide [Chitinophaga qingshengii]